MRKTVIFMCLMGLLLLFCACDKKESSPSPETAASPLPVEPLSEAEIARVEAAFAVMLGEEGEMSINPLNLFLTSHYDSAKELDMEAFLRYFPESGYGSEAEFQALKALPGWPFTQCESIKDMPVPLHCYPAEQVEAALEKYAGISIADVDISPEKGVYYLEEYNSFYNYTSDFGLEMPNYYAGERQGDTLRLYEQHFYHGKRLLTIKERDGGYLVLSHQKIED